MDRRIALATFVALLTAPVITACATGPRIGNTAKGALTVPQGFDGVALVARGPKIMLHRSFGQLDGASPDKNRRFWIASVGKQFTAAAIMKLAEQGRLALDDPISRYLRDVPADKAAITIRQLLTHTSGMGQSYVSEAKANRETAVDLMLAEPLQGPPGSGFRYSNSNFQLAAAVIEIASGKTYTDFVTRALWLPAGLRSTGFAGSAEAAKVTPISGKLPLRLQRSYWGEQGLFSTAGDLLRWYQAVTASSVLGKNSVRTMFAPAVKIGEGHAALGWFRGRTSQGTDYVFVRGNEDFGSNALLYGYPERDIVIIVLTHSGDLNEDMSWSRAVLHSLETQLDL